MMSQKSGPEAILEAQYHETQELENRIRALLAQRGSLDPSVRELRSRLREKYERIILTNHAFAESHDIELALWRLTYKRIDEFRSRIKKLQQQQLPAPPPSSASSTSKPGNHQQRREALQKLLDLFLTFLSEASGFYHGLIGKLKARYGLPHDYSFADLVLNSDKANNEALQACQLSCHRCLIYLGDLARYRELNGQGELAQRDWSVAAGYYLQAAFTWPDSGNPHNQLAVLATYMDDELLALYRYFRSLAVSLPFSTARENLLMLFEKNRQRYEALLSAKDKKQGGTSKGTGKGKQDAAAAAAAAAAGGGGGVVVLAAETGRRFCVLFVRIHGILFTKTNVDTLQEVLAAAMSELDALLLNNNTTTTSSSRGGDDEDDSAARAWSWVGPSHAPPVGPTQAGGSTAAHFLLHCAACLMFSVHSVANGTAAGSGGQAAAGPTYSQVLQRAELLQHARSALWGTAGRLCASLAQHVDPAASPLLPAVGTLLAWLATHPSVAFGGGEDMGGGGSQPQPQPQQQQQLFWSQVSQLLNRLCSLFPHLLSPPTSSSSSSSSSSSLPVLWEDAELRGFLPLTSTPSQPLAAARLGGGAYQRVQRVLLSGIQLAEHAQVAAGQQVQSGSVHGVGRVPWLTFHAHLQVFGAAGEAAVQGREESRQVCKGQEGGGGEVEGDAGLAEEAEAEAEAEASAAAAAAAVALGVLDAQEEEEEVDEVCGEGVGEYDDGEEDSGVIAWADEDGLSAPVLDASQSVMQQQQQAELEMWRQKQHVAAGSGGDAAVAAADASLPVPNVPSASAAPAPGMEAEEVIVFQPSSHAAAAAAAAAHSAPKASPAPPAMAPLTAPQQSAVMAAGSAGLDMALLQSLLTLPPAMPTQMPATALPPFAHSNSSVGGQGGYGGGGGGYSSPGWYGGVGLFPPGSLGELASRLYAPPPLTSHQQPQHQQPQPQQSFFQQPQPQPQQQRSQQLGVIGTAATPSASPGPRSGLGAGLGLGLGSGSGSGSGLGLDRESVPNHSAAGMSATPAPYDWMDQFTHVRPGGAHAHAGPSPAPAWGGTADSAAALSGAAAPWQVPPGAGVSWGSTAGRGDVVRGDGGEGSHGSHGRG